MSDFVEFALDRMTDWQRFEQLATEIVRKEGYPDVKPLGGVADEAVDAETERFFVNEGVRSRTVFQFTLQKTVASKIEKTIKRLDEAGQQHQRLVIVTATPITSDLQSKLKAAAKKDHDVDLDILERKTISSRLGDLENGLLRRFYPDLKAQLEILATKPSLPLAGERERELLRVSCAFTFSASGARARKALMDLAVLSVAARANNPATAAQIVALAKEALAAAAPSDEAQVTASLQRLIGERLVHQDHGAFAVTAAGMARLEAGKIKEESAGQGVVTELVASVASAAKTPVDELMLGRLEVNARELVLGYFRLMGVELAQAFLQSETSALVYAENTPHLRDVARRNVPPALGDMLLLAFGRALTNPTSEQAAYFAGVARSYMAAQILNIDPALREFQRTKFGEKTFVLDTDVALEAMIPDHPLSPVIKGLVAHLLEMGARVVVPDEVIEEVVTHLEISTNTFDYFGQGLSGLGREMADARIRNAFVYGYWHHSKRKATTREGYLKYRSNFYEKKNPFVFARDVIKAALPNIVTGRIEDVTGSRAEEEALAPVRAAFMVAISSSPKGRDRTEEQNRRLCDRDARLMMSLFQLNKSAERSREAVLGRRAYVLTASSRYIRVDTDLALNAKLTARPQLLAGLLDLISDKQLSDEQFAKLFENSILQEVIGFMWKDVKQLLDAGVVLGGASVVRLRYDLDGHLHEQIARLRDAEGAGDEAEVDKQYVELLREAEELGYTTVDELQRVKQEGKLLAERVEELARERDELREAVKMFGKKKQRYLERQAKASKP